MGFFRTSYHPGRAHNRNGPFPNGAGVGVANDDPSGETPFYGSCWQGDQRLIHARTTADASFYLARTLPYFVDDQARYTTGLQALRASLMAALQVQDEAGRFGQLYDVVAQNVAQSEGAGGLLWLPTIAAALPLFADDEAFSQQLTAAMRQAGAAYAPDVEAGYIVGAPEDVSLAPTSEDGYNAVMAYHALAELDDDPRWPHLWQQAADWTLGWRKAYNVRFDRRNMLGAGDFRTVGGDFASSNNNHLHLYGMNCLGSFDALAARTGDPYYQLRADDNQAFASQCLSHVTGQWNGQRGMCTEQFYTSDWSVWGDWDPGPAHQQKGTLMGFSHVWCVNMILLWQLNEQEIRSHPQ